MFLTTDALVLREVRYKEADRILTVLTSADGKMTVKARGALRKGSKTSASTQQLTYSQLVLFGNKGKWTVNEGSVIEGFQGLREDIELFSLASYFSECIDAIAPEEQPEPELLQLILNSLYALSRGMYDRELIKAAFELRLMALSGFCPEVSRCIACGDNEPEYPVLMLESGTLSCRKCLKGGEESVPLCPSSLEAVRYICSAPAKQLFSFSVDKPALGRLSHASERYLLTHMERGFQTLDYWKKIRIRMT